MLFYNFLVNFSLVLLSMWDYSYFFFLFIHPLFLFHLFWVNYLFKSPNKLIIWKGTLQCSPPKIACPQAICTCMPKPITRIPYTDVETIVEVVQRTKVPNTKVDHIIEVV